MAYLQGNTILERRNHLQALIKSKKLESIQRNLMTEIHRVLREIGQMQQKAEQLEFELGQITSQLGNSQYQAQWSGLEQRKISVEGEIEDITVHQIQEAEELLNDLQTLKGAVRGERNADRKAA